MYKLYLNEFWNTELLMKCKCNHYLLKKQKGLSGALWRGNAQGSWKKGVPGHPRHPPPYTHARAYANKGYTKIWCGIDMITSTPLEYWNRVNIIAPIKWFKQKWNKVYSINHEATCNFMICKKVPCVIGQG